MRKTPLLFKDEKIIRTGTIADFLKFVFRIIAFIAITLETIFLIYFIVRAIGSYSSYSNALVINDTVTATIAQINYNSFLAYTVTFVFIILASIGAFIFLHYEFFSLKLHLTNKRLIATRGFFTLHIIDVPLHTIQAVHLSANLLERWLGFGSLHIANAARHSIRLRFMDEPMRMYEAIEFELHKEVPPHTPSAPPAAPIAPTPIPSGHNPVPFATKPMTTPPPRTPN